jgi:hypothetical protein
MIAHYTKLNCAWVRHNMRSHLCTAIPIHKLFCFEAKKIYFQGQVSSVTTVKYVLTNSPVHLHGLQTLHAVFTYSAGFIFQFLCSFLVFFFFFGALVGLQYAWSVELCSYPLLKFGRITRGMNYTHTLCIW